MFQMSQHSAGYAPNDVANIPLHPRWGTLTGTFGTLQGTFGTFGTLQGTFGTLQCSKCSWTCPETARNQTFGT